MGVSSSSAVAGKEMRSPQIATTDPSLLPDEAGDPEDAEEGEKGFLPTSRASSSAIVAPWPQPKRWICGSVQSSGEDVSVSKSVRSFGKAEEGLGLGRGSNSGVKVLYHDQAGSSSRGILSVSRSTAKRLERDGSRDKVCDVRHDHEVVQEEVTGQIAVRERIETRRTGLELVTIAPPSKGG